jgi:hypothetical protein
LQAVQEVGNVKVYLPGVVASNGELLVWMVVEAEPGITVPAAKQQSSSCAVCTLLYIVHTTILKPTFIE